MRIAIGRMGASVGDVVRMIVGQGLTFAAAGLVAGGAVALIVGRFVVPLLFAQKARDPLVLLS
jgi:hypothetical protein